MYNQRGGVWGSVGVGDDSPYLLAGPYIPPNSRSVPKRVSLISSNMERGRMTIMDLVPCSLLFFAYTSLQYSFFKRIWTHTSFTLMSRYRNVSWTFFQPANRVRWQGGRPGSLQGTPTTWAYDTLEDAAASNPTTSGECSILFKYVYKWHPQILCGRVWLIFLKGPAV